MVRILLRAGMPCERHPLTLPPPPPPLSADWRKEAGLKWLIVLGAASLLTGYYKRFRWGPLKSRKISYHD